MVLFFLIIVIVLFINSKGLSHVYSLYTVRKYYLTLDISSDISTLITDNGKFPYVTLYDLNGGRKVADIDVDNYWIGVTDVSIGEELIGVVNYGRETYLYDRENGELMFNVSEVGSKSVAVSRRMIVTGDQEGSMIAWGCKNGGFLFEFEKKKQHTDGVISVEFSPVFNSSLLGSGSYDGKVKLWDTTSGKCINTLEGTNGYVNSISFSPNGKLLASGNEDTFIHIWDVKKGKCIQTLRGHTGSVYSVSFNADGQTLASSGEDKTIKLWDVKSGKCLYSSEKEEERSVNALKFTPDGQYLVSSNAMGFIKKWKVIQ